MTEGRRKGGGKKRKSTDDRGVKEEKDCKKKKKRLEKIRLYSRMRYLRRVYGKQGEVARSRSEREGRRGKVLKKQGKKPDISYEVKKSGLGNDSTMGKRDLKRSVRRKPGTFEKNPI